MSFILQNNLKFKNNTKLTTNNSVLRDKCKNSSEYHQGNNKNGNVYTWLSLEKMNFEIYYLVLRDF